MTVNAIIAGFYSLSFITVVKNATNVSYCGHSHFLQLLCYIAWFRKGQDVIMVVTALVLGSAGGLNKSTNPHIHVF